MSKEFILNENVLYVNNQYYRIDKMRIIEKCKKEYLTRDKNEPAEIKTLLIQPTDDKTLSSIQIVDSAIEEFIFHINDKKSALQKLSEIINREKRFLDSRMHDAKKNGN